MEGVIRDGRLVAVYISNDLGGAWSRDDFGNYELQCEPGGERQRELAFRMGVNLVMYALCLDYKADQVHVPFIMKRRRWKPDDGADPSVVGQAVTSSVPPLVRYISRGRASCSRSPDARVNAARAGWARRSVCSPAVGWCLAARRWSPDSAAHPAPGASGSTKYRWVMLAPWGRLGLALGARGGRDHRPAWRASRGAPHGAAT
jgi:hypothetical protein